MLLRDVLKSLFKKAVTSKYPFKKEKLPEALRGKIKWDSEKCIRCLTCVRVCPTGACQFFKKNKNDRGKIVIDFSKCSFCYQCVTNCPVKALIHTQEFELATRDRTKLKSDS